MMSYNSDDYTDIELKITLAKILPDKIVYIRLPDRNGARDDYFFKRTLGTRISDWDMLDLCYQAEETLNDEEIKWYSSLVNWHSYWYERVAALATVKGIKIYKEVE